MAHSRLVRLDGDVSALDLAASSARRRNGRVPWPGLYVRLSSNSQQTADEIGNAESARRKLLCNCRFAIRIVGANGWLVVLAADVADLVASVDRDSLRARCVLDLSKRAQAATNQH